MLYIKSSLTGDENEYIKAYRRSNPSFPHQATADQFFHETRFEVYRALGEHIGLGALEQLARAEDDACKEAQQAWQAAEHA